MQMNVFRVGQRGWLSFSQDGQASGDRAVLGVVRVGASRPVEIPAEAWLEAAPIYNGTIALRGATVIHAATADEVHVTLWWEALNAPGDDYTVFVHLVDREGHLLSNGDGPPLCGGFPTGMWQPGDVVVDQHVIPLPSDLSVGSYRVRVGWYEPVSGQRLPIGSGDYVELDKDVRAP
jgi:hypothetical protein